MSQLDNPQDLSEALNGKTITINWDTQNLEDNPDFTVVSGPSWSDWQIQYNNGGAFWGWPKWDDVKNAIWVQVSDPLGAAHFLSNTGATINDVTTGSVSLVTETLPAIPSGSITQIQEPTAWSGGYASYTNGGSGTAITANGSTYDFRVYPCLYVSSTGTYYRSQFYEAISAGTDLNDAQGYDIQVSWGTVTITGETVYYFVEYDVNSAGSWSPLGVYNSTSETFTSLSGSNSTTAFPTYYNNTPWTPAGSPSGLSQSVINEWSGTFSGSSNGTTWYYEIDAYVTISGTKYVSGTATTSSLIDNNNWQSYDWSLSYTPWSPAEGHILRRSSDNSTWEYTYTDASGSYTDYWFTNDTDAASRWGQTYSAGSITYNFTPHGQGTAPSGNTVYSVAGSQYNTSLPADSTNYIFKHTFTGNATGKILDNNQSLYGQSYTSSTFYDVGYPTWVTGTTVTPQSYWFTGTNQNRDYKAYGFNGSIYSVTPLTLSTTSSGGTKYVSGSVTYPSGITSIKILRQINWGGYTVSKTLTSPTTAFTDDSTDNSWSGNTTVTPNAVIPTTLRLDREITSVSSTTPLQLQLVGTGTGTRHAGLSWGVATDSTSTPTFQSHLYHSSSTGYLSMVTGRLEISGSIGGTATTMFGNTNVINNANSSSVHFQVKWQNDSNLINTRSDQDTVWFGSASWIDQQATIVSQPARSSDVAMVLMWHASMSSTSPLLRTQTSGGSYGAYITVWGHFQAWSDNNTNPWHSWRSDPNTGFTNPTADTIWWVTGGSERCRLDSSGRFWVGNTTITAYIDAPASTTSISSFRIRAGTAPTSPNEWDFWNNSTVKWIGVYADWVSGFISRTLFTQTASVTVSNTTTETTLTGSGTGTLTLPANFFTAWKQLRITMWGYHSTVATPNLNMRVKLGSTTICATGNHAMHNDTNGMFRIEAVITCRTTGSSGTVFGQWLFNDYGTGGDTTQMVNTTTTTINTTTTQALTITAQFNAASTSNTITCTNLSLETLN